jgi:hypothetical protein
LASVLIVKLRQQHREADLVELRYSRQHIVDLALTI